MSTETRKKKIFPSFKKKQELCTLTTAQMEQSNNEFQKVSDIPFLKRFFNPLNECEQNACYDLYLCWKHEIMEILENIIANYSGKSKASYAERAQSQDIIDNLIQFISENSDNLQLNNPTEYLFKYLQNADFNLSRELYRDIFLRVRLKKLSASVEKARKNMLKPKRSFWV